MISWNETTTSPPRCRYTPYLTSPYLRLHSTALPAFARRAQHDADLVDHPLAHALVERLDQRRAPQAELVGARRQIGHHDQGTPPHARRAGVPGPRFPGDLAHKQRLTGSIQVRQHVIEEDDGPLPPLFLKQVHLRQPQAERGGVVLTS